MAGEGIEKIVISSIWDIPFDEPKPGELDQSRLIDLFVTGPNEVTSRIQHADGIVVDYVVRPETLHEEVEEYYWDEMERDVDPKPLPENPFTEY